MRHWIRVPGVAVVVLVATACGPGTSPTTQTGSAALGTPIARSSSPTTAATPAVPPPDAGGQYRQLTFAQAQQLAPFPLVQPTWVPSYLHAAGITASVPNITEVRLTTPAAEATPPAGPVQVVSLTFGGPDPNEFTVVINELRQGTPLGPPEGPGSGPVPPGFGTTTTLTIAGHPVTRTTWAVTANYPVGGPSAAYVWTNQGTTFQFLALIESPVTEQDVEHMIASMLGR